MYGLNNWLKDSLGEEYGWTWAELGVPRGVVEEHNGSDVRLFDPPEGLVKRTVAEARKLFLLKK